MDDDTVVVSKLVELLKVVLDPASSSQSRIDSQSVVLVPYRICNTNNNNDNKVLNFCFNDCHRYYIEYILYLIIN